MPIFGTSTPFDKLIEKATNETNTTEDWQSVLECCDYINQINTRCIDCFRSIMKRMLHNQSNVSLQAVILLDACVSNCGKKFHLEVASREFETEARKLLAKGHPRVIEKFKIMLKKWTENEFKNDPELVYLNSFYQALKNEGVDFTYNDPMRPPIPKDPNVVTSDQEEEDIIKAIEASLKTAPSVALYPDISQPPSSNNFPSNSIDNSAKSNNDSVTSVKIRELFRVRALYDFGAVEDNELTFKAGEIIVVTDDSDENWWSGMNDRGRGLFPANFTTKDLEAKPEEPAHSESVKTKELEEEALVIDERKLDRYLELLRQADPTGRIPDPPELSVLQEYNKKLKPLLMQRLLKIDMYKAEKSRVFKLYDEAMELYFSHL